MAFFLLGVIAVGGVLWAAEPFVEMRPKDRWVFVGIVAAVATACLILAQVPFLDHLPDVGP